MKFSISNTIRTNNFTDHDIQTKLITLWKENTAFIQQANEKKQTVAAIYHDYESDYKGDYSVSIAKESDSDDAFDTTMYQWKEYSVDRSDSLGVLNAWKQVWADEDAQVIDRVYDFDFERYSPSGEIAILIAVQ